AVTPGGADPVARKDQALIGNPGEIGAGFEQGPGVPQLAGARQVERVAPGRMGPGDGLPALRHHLPDVVAAVGVAAGAREEGPGEGIAGGGPSRGGLLWV